MLLELASVASIAHCIVRRDGSVAFGAPRA
jgi:hypothetical protein